MLSQQEKLLSQQEKLLGMESLLSFRSRMTWNSFGAGDTGES